MAAKDPQQVAAKWVANIQSAQQSMLNGANAVTESPAAGAVRSKAKMQAKWQAAMQNGGKWDTAMAKVTVDQWRTAYVQKGIPRIGQGAQAAMPKMADFLTQLIPFQQAGLAKIKAMPALNLSDSKARASAWIDYMATFKRR